VATKIVLTRHGHVEGISPPRFRGRADIPLSDLGRAQAQATARRIAASWRPRRVYTSPLGRCVATGAAIATACRITSEVRAGLNDLDYGAWQWKTYSEVERDCPETYALWRKMPHLVRFPDGESLQDLVARVGDCLRFTLERHPDETVVLVGHDSVNRALLMQILDQPLSAYWRVVLAPCGISEIDFVDSIPSVLLINDTSHLLGID
jgi:phosphoserine phosphatase